MKKGEGALEALRAHFVVLTHGAVGDGVTDDGAALERAFGAAAAASAAAGASGPTLAALTGEIGK